MELFRQGDVLVRRIDALPAGLKEVPRDHGRIVLAEGEVTGHAHAILDRNARLLSISEDEIDVRFLEITASLTDTQERGVQIVHEEHSTITLAPGFYEVRRQSEYTPRGLQRVAD